MIISGLFLKKIEKIFETCALIRFAELEISKRYNSGLMRCPVHLSIGQEGVAAALSVLLETKDYVVSTHRSHAHFLGKGGKLSKMLSEIYGKSNGCSGGKGGSMHLVDKKRGFMGSSSIVGNSIPIGVGLGLSLKIKKKKNLSIIFFGDAAVETGVFFESVNFAIIKKIPIIFICENNLYSVYTHLKERQPENRKIYKMVSGMGLDSYHFDGSNPLTFFKKLELIIKDCKKNSKPCFIEFSTYRYMEHCGPYNDDELKYRPKEEIKLWEKKDPYNILKYFLLKKNKKKVDKIEKKIKKIIEKSFFFAEKSAFPNKKKLYSNVYKK